MVTSASGRSPTSAEGGAAARSRRMRRPRSPCYDARSGAGSYDRRRGSVRARTDPGARGAHDTGPIAGAAVTSPWPPAASPPPGAPRDRPRRSRALIALAVLGVAVTGAVAALRIYATDEPLAPSPASPPRSASAPAVQPPPPPASAVQSPSPSSPSVDGTAEATSSDPEPPALHTPAPLRSPTRHGKPPRVRWDPAPRN